MPKATPFLSVFLLYPLCNGIRTICESTLKKTDLSIELLCIAWCKTVTKMYIFNLRISCDFKTCVYHSLQICYKNLVKEFQFWLDWLFGTQSITSNLENSGSIPRNACVACETELWECHRRTGTDRQTDRRTDRRRTKWSLCVAMLRRRHKNKTESDLYDLPFKLSCRGSLTVNPVHSK